MDHSVSSPTRRWKATFARWRTFASDWEVLIPIKFRSVFAKTLGNLGVRGHWDLYWPCVSLPWKTTSFLNDSAQHSLKLPCAKLSCFWESQSDTGAQLVLKDNQEINIGVAWNLAWFHQGISYCYSKVSTLCSDMDKTKMWRLADDHSICLVHSSLLGGSHQVVTRANHMPHLVLSFRPFKPFSNSVTSPLSSTPLSVQTFVSLTDEVIVSL